MFKFCFYKNNFKCYTSFHHILGNILRKLCKSLIKYNILLIQLKELIVGSW